MIASQRGRILLVRRARDPWRGRWDVPGGYVEDGEDARAAGEREFQEETGRRVESPSLFGVWTDPSSDSRYTSNVCVYYQATVSEHTAPSWPEAFVPNEEIAAIKWFCADSLPKEFAFPAHLPRVIDTWLAQTAVRQASCAPGASPPRRVGASSAVRHGAEAEPIT